MDNKERFASILAGLSEIAIEFHLPVIYPIHPRSRKMMTQFSLEPRNLQLVEPLDYLPFLQLESNARLVFTDSGGVQEECCILGVPCVTLRDNTERPETLEVGSNILAGAISGRILECSQIMLGRENNWANPFGDGKAGLAEVDGIAYIKDDSVYKTSQRRYITNLDELLFPARHLLLSKDYGGPQYRGNKITTIITSRGCPYSCSFCDYRYLMGPKFRRRSPQNVANEIEEYISKYNI